MFRIGSITKVFTAIAVMQLCEEGLVDLDAPANNYLRSYELVCAARVSASHTAASADPHLRNPRGAPHRRCVPPESQRGVRGTVAVAGRVLPRRSAGGRPARHRVRVLQPWVRHARSDHRGRQRDDARALLPGADLRAARDERQRPGPVRAIGARLATGYTLGRRGAQVVPDRDWIGAAAGGMYSTTSDIARFAAALMRGGVSGHGRVLDPAALARMFDAHYRPDPHLPGWARVPPGRGGRASRGRARRVCSGFQLRVPGGPDDGVGVVAFTNGSKGAFCRCRPS